MNRLYKHRMLRFRPAASLYFASLALCICIAAPAAARPLKWVSPAPDANAAAQSKPNTAANTTANTIAPAGPTSAPGAPPASAGGAPARSGDYLARMDQDHDGRVSLREYQDWLSYAFDRMDANRDGVLTPGEQPGGRGDALTREQHRARVGDTFRRQDLNRDGSLDSRELAAPPQAPRP